VYWKRSSFLSVVSELEGLKKRLGQRDPNWNCAGKACESPVQGPDPGEPEASSLALGGYEIYVKIGMEIV